MNVTLVPQAMRFWKKLKRLARYLKDRPRMVTKFLNQVPPETIDGYGDTDYAGCRRTRRSTSGGMVMHGRHILKTWSTTQATVALSSGEAELHGVV